jgi:hypothetical protein
MNKIKAFVIAFFSIFSVALVIKGQSIKSYYGLLIMMIGLSGLLTLLYLYNRRHV